MIIWAIWMNHNTKVWDNEAKPTSEAVSSILGWYAEYREVHVSNNVPIPVPKVSWQKSGMVKLNVDAAFDNPNSLTGIGVIFRDADGIFLNGFQHSLPNAASLRHAELHALMLEYALSYHLVSLIVETDCQELVYAITGHSLDHFDLGFLISDLKQLLQQTDSAILCHVKSESNKVAHTLAREAKLAIYSDNFVIVIPLSMEVLFSHDCNDV
ncbi:hypothetical protein ACLB2K_068551 [Fragaria x ananassa]